jgi:hypothetical protein
MIIRKEVNIMTIRQKMELVLVVIAAVIWSVLVPIIL